MPTPTYTPPANLVDFQDLINKLIAASVSFAFIALVIVLTVAGFKYLISGGEPKGIQSATQTITWALLGMLFLIIIWLIVQLIESFTGVKITNFCIGFRPYCA